MSQYYKWQFWKPSQPTSKPSQETTGNKYHNDETDKEQTFVKPCPPITTTKTLEETTRNQCHNNETDKEDNYEESFQPTTTSKTLQETTRNQCHNKETDNENCYEKIGPSSNEASETNRAESASYEEIKKKQFEGVENQKFGEECQWCPLLSMKTEN